MKATSLWWIGALLLLASRGVSAQEPEVEGLSEFRSSFLFGLMDGAEAEADKLIREGQLRQQPKLLIEGEFAKGLCALAKDDIDAVDATWARAAETASTANLEVEKARLLGFRSLLMLGKDRGRTSELLNQAFATAMNAADTSRADMANIMNWLGVGFTASGDLSLARRCFDNAMELLNRMGEEHLAKGVVAHNVGLRGLIGEFTWNMGPVAYDSVAADLYSALQHFSIGGSNVVGIGSTTLHLAWLAAARGDEGTMGRYSGQFLGVVEKARGAELQVLDGLLGQMLLWARDAENAGEPASVRSMGALRLLLPRMEDVLNGSLSNSDGKGNRLGRPDTRSGLWLFRRGIEVGISAWALSGAWLDAEEPLELQSGLTTLAEGLMASLMASELSKPENVAATKKMIELIEQRSAELATSTNREANTERFAMAIAKEMFSSTLEPSGDKLRLPPSARAPTEAITNQLPYASRQPSGTRLLGQLFADRSADEARNFWTTTRQTYFGDSLGGSSIDFDQGLVTGLLARVMGGAVSVPLLETPTGQSSGWAIIEDARSISYLHHRLLRSELQRPENSASRGDFFVAQSKFWETFQELYRQVAHHPEEPFAAVLARLRTSKEAVDAMARSLIHSGAKRVGVPEMPTSVALASALPEDATYVVFSENTPGQEADIFRSRRQVILVERASPGDARVISAPVSFPAGLMFQRMVLSRDGKLEDIARLGAKLYAEMFPGDVGERIRQSKRLLISPASDLWSFPFGALVVNRQGAPQYLGLEKPITYTECLPLLRAIRERNYGSRSAGIVSVGVAEFGSKNAAEIQKRFGEGRLDDLSGAGDEAMAVATVYGTSALAGADAFEPATCERLQRASVAHFATHSYPADLNPVVSSANYSPAMKLAFSGWSGVWLPSHPSATTLDFTSDGLLQAWEIATRLDLSLDTVTLAVCSGGSMKNVIATGPELPMAFLYAGARTVLSAQAPLDDKFSLEFMPEFHKALRGGRPKDAALRDTVKAMNRNRTYRHPGFWAPLILIGDPDNVGVN